MNADVTIFHLLNNLAGAWPPLDWLTRFFVNDFAIPTVMSLVAVWLWTSGKSPAERKRNQYGVIVIALGILFGNALIKDLSYIYFRPRPFATETVKLLFYRPSVSSFPSVPVAVAFSFAAGTWYSARRLGIAQFILATLYGLSRIVAGVHYPSDVLGGAAIGVGAVYAVVRLRFVFEPTADAFLRLLRRLSIA